MTFAIRAGILNQLGDQFSLSYTQLGYINGIAFLGFPIATIIGGLLYNTIGLENILYPGIIMISRSIAIQK